MMRDPNEAFTLAGEPVYLDYYFNEENIRDKDTLRDAVSDDMDQEHITFRVVLDNLDELWDAYCVYAQKQGITL
jgi:hypothetical protein